MTIGNKQRIIIETNSKPVTFEEVFEEVVEEFIEAVFDD